jgi:hypothetical protein
LSSIDALYHNGYKHQGALFAAGFLVHTMVHLAQAAPGLTPHLTGKSVATAATVMLRMEQGPRPPFPFLAAQKPLRLKSNFLNQINLIWAVQSLAKKYFCFSESQIISIFPAIPSHQRGVSRSSETRGGVRWTRQRRARQ